MSNLSDRCKTAVAGGSIKHVDQGVWRERIAESRMLIEQPR